MPYLNWGILGAAKFAREFMGPALHLAPGGRLTAVATRDPARAQPFRGIAPDLVVHDSYDALLADPAIDAVYIPLPNSMHVDWTLKALDAGKHVLTEKPVAMRASEIDDLIAARDRSGKLAAEAFMIVFHPQWAHARDLVRGGSIGRLLHIGGMFCFNLTDGGNIRNQAELGGGALRDIGCYVLGSSRFVLGAEPQDVHGAIRWENGVDVFTQIRGRFDTVTYDAVISTRMHPSQEMVFYGDRGTVRLTAPFNPQVFGEAQVQWRREDGDLITRRFPAARHYELQVAAFNEAALTGAPYACPLEFSRGTQAIVDQIFDAHLTIG
ncbi:MAG: Gfo/Idh/MocA family oxidoreductase [Rhodobacteraceae bacterium]|nr:Gfo/Idh/MocA family oxidoreductase [Paracoccaceae bacterium]